MHTKKNMKRTQNNTLTCNHKWMEFSENSRCVPVALPPYFQMDSGEFQSSILPPSSYALVAEWLIYSAILSVLIVFSKDAAKKPALNKTPNVPAGWGVSSQPEDIMLDLLTFVLTWRVGMWCPATTSCFLPGNHRSEILAISTCEFVVGK